MEFSCWVYEQSSILELDNKEKLLITCSDTLNGVRHYGKSCASLAESKQYHTMLIVLLSWLNPTFLMYEVYVLLYMISLKSFQSLYIKQKRWQPLAASGNDCIRPVQFA